MKRVNAGHHEAIYRVARYYFMGEMYGLRQDKAEGLRWHDRAIEAGSGDAAYNIGNIYLNGDGVEQDHVRAFEYFQKAAKLGDIHAFLQVGHVLLSKGEIEEGMLNYRKAAICGMSEDSLFDLLRNGCRDGFITKEEYAFTLRENQKACNEINSEGREMWKEMLSD